MNKIKRQIQLRWSVHFVNPVNLVNSYFLALYGVIKT